MNPKYAVMQKSLAPPTIEQLRLAFQGVRGLTAADAFVLGKDAFGIIVKGFEFDRATELKTRLEAQGVEIELVEETSLPVLPPMRQVNQLECAPDALMIFDPLGRSFPLEWKNVGMIAAGKVTLDEFNRVATDVRTPFYYRGRGPGDPEIRTEYSTEHERNNRLLLEVMVRGAVLRYGTNADKSAHVLFRCLGDRQTDDLETNFRLLVQDLVRHAPDATLNRGASYLNEYSSPPFYYPSKNAFYEEMTWLLWQMKK